MMPSAIIAVVVGLLLLAYLSRTVQFQAAHSDEGYLLRYGLPIKVVGIVAIVFWLAMVFLAFEAPESQRYR